MSRVTSAGSKPGAERTAPGYFMLLSTFDNGALDGGREAVLEHFEDDARRRRTDAVNPRQDASVEQRAATRGDRHQFGVTEHRHNRKA